MNFFGLIESLVLSLYITLAVPQATLSPEQESHCSCCINRGEAGPPGSPGVPGAPGPSGIPGNHGNNGNNGQIGLPGVKGDKGNRGPEGPRGNKGLEGLAGVMGKHGIQGLTGPRGTIGPIGDPGEAGPMGPPGSRGSKGDRGDGYWAGIRHGLQGGNPRGQSAFSVACSTQFHADPIEDSYLIFDTEFVNIGNDFDIARGTFNTRINGTYYFVLHANKWSNQNHLYLKIMKNGVLMTALYEDAGFDYYDAASTSLLLHLVQGDQVWVLLHVNNEVYGGLSKMTTFSGWLIFEDPEPYY